MTEEWQKQAQEFLKENATIGNTEECWPWKEKKSPAAKDPRISVAFKGTVYRLNKLVWLAYGNEAATNKQKLCRTCPEITCVNIKHYKLRNLYQFTARPDDKPVSENEKKCIQCLQTKSLEDFPKRSKGADGLHFYCKDCSKERRKRNYDHGIAYRCQTYLHNLKEKAKCVDCGVSYPGEPWLLEFDHLDSTLKVKAVTILASKGKMSAMLEEIAKCELVCVVCHKRRTAKRASWQCYAEGYFKRENPLYLD